MSNIQLRGETRPAIPPAGKPHTNRTPSGGLTYIKGKAYGPDRIGIVAYHDNPFVVARPVDAYAAWLRERINRLPGMVRGCTNIAAGIRQANEMLAKTPRGVLRRMWLLSDGEDTHGGWPRIQHAVAESRQMFININTIGFGDSFDVHLLRKIAENTHNGRMYTANSLRELVAVLRQTKPGNGRAQFHRAETSVMVVDVSYSMDGRMGNQTRIAVVVEALHQLITYKQKLFS